MSRVARLAELRRKQQHKQGPPAATTPDEPAVPAGAEQGVAGTEEAVEAATEDATEDAEDAMSSEKPTQTSTYNSDLKLDLAPLLTKAQLGTDRAVNRLVQQKYEQ